MVNLKSEVLNLGFCSRLPVWKGASIKILTSNPCLIRWDYHPSKYMRPRQFSFYKLPVCSLLTPMLKLILDNLKVKNCFPAFLLSLKVKVLSKKSYLLKIPDHIFWAFFFFLLPPPTPSLPTTTPYASHKLKLLLLPSLLFRPRWPPSLISRCEGVVSEVSYWF